MSAQKVFKTVTMIPDYINGHMVQWELDPFFRGERPYNFSLEISQTADFSELIAVKNNLGDVFYAIDDFNLKQSWGQSYYYRVILYTGDGQTHCSKAISFGAHKVELRKYAMAAEIIRKELLACRYAGQKGWLLKRKSYGKAPARIAKNLDPVSGVPLSDTKEEDYGVGLDGGYFNPAPCAFYFENSSQDRQLDREGIGVKETFDFLAKFPGFPMLEVRDVVCDADDGSRYSVMSKAYKSFPGTSITVIQKVTLRLIAPTDTIYSIPIPTV
jgi:hypothetical protein